MNLFNKILSKLGSNKELELEKRELELAIREDQLDKEINSIVEEKIVQYVSPTLDSIEKTPDFGGSRTSIPSWNTGGGGVGEALPKRVKTELSLNERKFNNLSIEETIELLVDAHPDLSYAVWNFLRIGNSGMHVEVEKLNGKRWEQAEKEINEFIRTQDYPNNETFQKSRSMDKVVNQLMQSVILSGACALEMVLTGGSSDVSFFAPVDPNSVVFKAENDRYIPYQDDETISLDIPTFFYEGIDELVDSPYGRSPILGAINMVLFQMQVLNDLKAVVHNNGYPKLDISILEEVLLKKVPLQYRNNPVEKQKWLSEKMQEIIDAYTDLEPDDALIHFDSVEIKTVGGGSGGKGAMIDPGKLMNAIDNLIMSGLKTLSTILGRRSTGNTESFAKMEIKLYLKGVEAIQKVVGDVLSKSFTLFLNLRGKQGIAKVKFKPVEIRTELEQEQFRQIQLMNLQFMRDQGWIDQDEAAMKAVGHAPVSPTPLVNETPTNQDGNPVSGTPDENPGNNTDTDTDN